MSLKLEAFRKSSVQVSTTMTVRRLVVASQVAGRSQCAVVELPVTNYEEREPGCCLIRERQNTMFCNRLLPATVQNLP